MNKHELKSLLESIAAVSGGYDPAFDLAPKKWNYKMKFDSRMPQSYGSEEFRNTEANFMNNGIRHIESSIEHHTQNKNGDPGVRQQRIAHLQEVLPLLKSHDKRQNPTGTDKAALSGDYLQSKLTAGGIHPEVIKDITAYVTHSERDDVDKKRRSPEEPLRPVT